MRTLKYISGIPGIGKTKWAVTQLVECIKTKASISMYVAPTVDLLDEVKKYLLMQLTGQEAQKILTFHSRDDKFGSVTQGIRLALEGGVDQHGREFKKAEYGTVILVTHAGFLGLRKVPNAHNINLYFDEARKCVSQSTTIKLTSKAQKTIISKILDVTDVEGTGFKNVKVKVSPKEYSQLMKETKWESRQKRNVDALVKSAVNPRLETYVQMPDSVSSLTLFEVTLPSKIFEGFNNVVLLSAYFEDSQMYHLLKLKNTRMVDITKVTVESYQKRFARIVNRYKKVVIIPLMPQIHALSKNNLQGFLISSHTPDILTELSDSGYTKRKDLRILKEYVLDSNTYKLSEKDQAAVKLLKDNRKHISFDPLQWLLKESNKLIDAWAAQNETEEKTEPLLIVNKAYERRASSLAPNMKIISTQVHGLNKFYKHTVVVFLAAINPSPALFKFYKHFLPDYDVEVDHVADVCIQCVCRGSVRDTKATEASLVIVPDLKVMTLLADKMLWSPSLRSDMSPKANMIAASLTSDVTKLAVKTKKDNLTNKVRQEKYKQDPLNKELARLRVNISEYKKKVANGNTAAQGKLNEYTAKLAELVAKRDAAKDN